ncbi:MAG: PQQ-binding-like beta-propeller repeat protein, partial [Eubacterium sp.]|nr:PQQ-binding-like beta-propeller repeat protein [Eubacterium sp.]
MNAQELNDERVPSAQSLDSACGDAVPALNSSRGDAVPELDSACGDAATALSSTRGAAPHAPSTLPGLAGARWTAAFSDPYFMGTSMTSTPVISGDTVYVVNRDTLYALSTKTGKTQYELTLPLRMNSVCDPILVDDRLYIPLSGGSLVCVDIQQRAILWTSEEITAAPGISYQTLGRLYYHNGYLYAGVWAMAGRGSSEDVNSTGVFFCVRAKDGSTVWQYQDTSHPAGYYWNQAVSCHDRLYFMSEDGALISHGLTDTKVYETRSLT